ncbi:MAG: hypothetical protein ACI8QF_004007 [Limisphaerales bacterium]|jgi:hypothetical protein
MKQNNQTRRARSGLTVWLAAMGVLLCVGCGGPDKARLTVTELSYEGGSETVIEYSGPGGKAEQQVIDHFNGSIGESSYEGNFAEIHAALSGKEPFSPKSINTVPQILDAAEVGRWSIVEETKTKEDGTKGMGSFITVREIHLIREEPAPVE